MPLLPPPPQPQTLTYTLCPCSPPTLQPQTLTYSLCPCSPPHSSPTLYGLLVDNASMVDPALLALNCQQLACGAGGLPPCAVFFCPDCGCMPGTGGLLLPLNISAACRGSMRLPYMCELPADARGAGWTAAAVVNLTRPTTTEAPDPGP